ncbi:hypothetical protein K440DRAFT_680897 [Wilcoxina mikolae CBS 423.85]|nr:hypothetical protein K440DRAFT_680897 [Wilcoxina mikolae CBS 423.85]
MKHASLGSGMTALPVPTRNVRVLVQGEIGDGVVDHGRTERGESACIILFKPRQCQASGEIHGGTVLHLRSHLARTPELPVSHKHQTGIAGNVEHTALVFGSSTSRNNTILSDIGIMTFALDSFCTTESSEELKQLVIQTFKEFDVQLDAEVPYERKLLIPISFAEASHRMVPFANSRGHIPGMPALR